MAQILLLILLFDPRIVFDRNPNDTANREFKFKNIASPMKDDAASTAKLTLIDGELDQGSAELSALTDGRLPSDEDEPGANVFFRAASSGGRFRMDFNTPIDIAQVNSYSWHPVFHLQPWAARLSMSGTWPNSFANMVTLSFWSAQNPIRLDRKAP